MISFVCYLIHDIVSPRILNIHFANFGGRGGRRLLIILCSSVPIIHPLPGLCCGDRPATRISQVPPSGWSSGRETLAVLEGWGKTGVPASSSFPPALSGGCMPPRLYLYFEAPTALGFSSIASSLYPSRHRDTKGFPCCWTLGTSPCRVVCRHSAHVSGRRPFLESLQSS